MPSKYGYRGYGAARTPGSQDRGLQDEKLSAGKIYSAKTGKLMNKGGGADTGRIGEFRSRLGVAINKAKRMNKRLKSHNLKAPERQPMIPLKKKG